MTLLFSLQPTAAVFGEVESGIEVIGKITSVPRDTNKRPLGDIKMKIELIR
jgi:cyclophilin family peptidyl-prolyl cis-trans isomerase